MSKQSNQSNQPSQSALTIEELRQRLLDQLSLEQKIIEELSDDELNVIDGGATIHEVLEIPHLGRVHSTSSSVHSVPGTSESSSGIPIAWRASVSGLAAGGVASFVVGGIAGKLSVSG